MPPTNGLHPMVPLDMTSKAIPASKQIPPTPLRTVKVSVDSATAVTTVSVVLGFPTNKSLIILPEPHPIKRSSNDRLKYFKLKDI